MSLYKFFESFVDKNKELTMINLKKPMNYFHAFCDTMNSVISSWRSALPTPPTVFDDLLKSCCVSVLNCPKYGGRMLETL